MIFKDLKISEKTNSKIPKYIWLAGQIESWISSNRLKPGTKLPTDRQLAKHFTVTPVTINRSLQELVKKGIIERRVGSGTYIATHKSKNKTLRIGILCHDTPVQDDCYVSKVLFTFHNFWKDYRSDIITLVKSAKEYRQAIKEYSLDGVMVLTPQEEFEPEIAALRAEGYPIVSIGVKFPDLQGCSFGTNHEQAANEAVKYFVRHGHRRIGIITPDSQWASVKKRLDGYQKAMWEAQLPVNPAWIIKKSSWEQDIPKQQLKKMMKSPLPPTAFLIVAYSDIIATYSALSELDIKIPDDVSLIAFDDPSYAAQLAPPLTVWAQPIEKFSQKAAKALLNMINKTKEKFEDDTPKLIQRSSCRALTQ